nr:MAG TPA: hypothetical protein [Caudoviricetes sp.]
MVATLNFVRVFDIFITPLHNKRAAPEETALSKTYLFNFLHR